MEAKIKKSNRFCCELVRSSSFATKSILIFILSLCMCLITNTNVKAYTYPTMSVRQAEEIINYFNNKQSYVSCVTYSDIITDQEVHNILDNLSPQTIAQNFNTQIANIEDDITWENITVYLAKGQVGAATNNSITITFFISNNDTNTNLGYLKYFYRGQQAYNYSQIYRNSGYSKEIDIVIYNNNNQITINNVDFRDSSEIIYPKVAPNIVNTNQIDNFDFLMLINKNTSMYYELYNTKCEVIGDITYFNNDGTVSGDQQIENTDQSEYGYLWSPAYSGETRVNLLHEGNSNIDCDYYIGNELTHTYNFYYYSGDSKISVNDHISIYTTQTTSGDWYKHYITNSGKEHLPNNTHFLLDVYATLGSQTATVIEDFNAFYTVEEIIPTPTPIPTSTPTPTPTPDIGTISGQINDINNNITNSTQTIVGQLSGDTQKITEAITKELTTEELDSILPVSGDYVQQMGYRPQISPYNGFIVNIYNVIKEALLGEGNVNLYVEYHGYSEYIASNRYYVPNNPFKIWMTAGMIALICWEIAKFGDQITQKLEKADISVIHYADADMYFF